MTVQLQLQRSKTQFVKSVAVAGLAHLPIEVISSCLGRATGRESGVLRQPLYSKEKIILHPGLLGARGAAVCVLASIGTQHLEGKEWLRATVRR